jgi:hypothetical protein
MSDVASIRLASTLPTASAKSAGSIRFTGDQAVICTGTQWAPTCNVIINAVVGASAQDVDKNIFIADKAYQIVSVKEAHAVASGSVSASGTAVLGTVAEGTAVLGTDANSDKVVSITRTVAGSGYSVAPVVTIAAPPAGGGHTRATAHVTLSNGTVSAFVMDSNGAGYEEAPGVTVADPDQIVSITLGVGGSGYTAVPDVVIGDPDDEGGTTATAHATIDAGAVTGFVMDVKGAGYSSVPDVTVTGGNGVTISVNKCTGTQAPSAGTLVTSAAFDSNSAVNTIQTGSVVTTSAATLATGDRLGVDITGTAGSYAGSAITVVLRAK